MPKGYMKDLEKSQEKNKLEKLKILLNRNYSTTNDLIEMVNQAREILGENSSSGK